MKEIGSFVEFCAKKALLTGKRGLFMFGCPIKWLHVYFHLNIHGLSIHKGLTYGFLTIQKVDGIAAYVKDTVNVQNWRVRNSLVVLILLRF